VGKHVNPSCTSIFVNATWDSAATGPVYAPCNLSLNRTPTSGQSEEKDPADSTQLKYGVISQEEIDKLTRAVRQYAESNELSTTDYT
jgi:hypothetical protein